MSGSGTAYLAGRTASANFPTQQPLHGRAGLTDAFVTILQWNAATSQLSYGYSTVLGSTQDDDATGIALDSVGNAIVVGTTTSPDFPLGYRDPLGRMGDSAPIAFVTKLSVPTSPPATRVIAYTYDGLLRLIGAVASPGNSYTYIYDLAGNRTSVQTNGGTPVTRTYNAADQITNAGYSYDLAGNLLTDGTLTYTYDALNRTKTLAGAQSRTYTYNGDGVLVRQVAGATTTDYTQDLAAPLSQILQTKVGATTTHYLYGLERLATKASSTRTWYLGDALGSVRRTLNDSGAATAPLFYDPWGTVESGTVPTFGFTGELQDTAAGLVNLRARWYSTARGTFTSRDSFPGFAEQPYSQHPYQYGLSDPVLLTDPSGRCNTAGDDYCFPINTWAEFEAHYQFRYRFESLAATPPTVIVNAQPFTPGRAVVYAEAYLRYMRNPSAYEPFADTAVQAEIFAEYFLGVNLDSIAAAQAMEGIEHIHAQARGRPFTADEFKCLWGYGLALGMADLIGMLGQASMAVSSLGRAATLRGPRLGISAENATEFWENRLARILDEEVLKQPDEHTCVGTCARIAGLPDRVAAELEALARSNSEKGVTQQEILDVLKRNGINAQPHQFAGARASLPEIQKLLANGQKVLLDVQTGRASRHAVLIRSIDSVGSGWRIQIQDPAIGRVVELDFQSWTMTVGSEANVITFP